MTQDLDRFDRMLLAATAASAAPVIAPAPPPPRETEAERRRRQRLDRARDRRWERRAELEGAARQQAVITSERPPRFVDHMTCPMCSVDRLGVEYHGELMSGAKVHTVTAHCAGMRRVERGQPRCLGAGMRVVFEDGVWKGAPA